MNLRVIEGATALDELIARIYDSTLEPDRWDEVLRLVVERFDTKGWDIALLLESRQLPPAGRFLGATGLASETKNTYLARFAGRNPWTKRLTPAPLGIVIDSDEMMPRAELLESDFYKYLLGPLGIDRALAVLLDRRDGITLGFVLSGPGNADVVRLKNTLQVLAPHLQRAVRIGLALGTTRLQLSAANSALDRSSHAVVMLTAGLSTIGANAKAQELAASGLIHLAGTFRFADSKAQARLCDMARRNQAAASFMAETADGTRVPVHAERITTGAAGVIGGTIEGAGLIVSITAPLGPPDAARISAWFGLTPSEANLTAALLGGLSLTAYAARRTISVNAVRFLLKGVYRKTGVSSRGQLVARMRDLPLI